MSLLVAKLAMAHPDFYRERIEYLHEQARSVYEVTIGKDGKFYRANGELLDTSRGHTISNGDTLFTGHAIFVIGLDGRLYVSLRHAEGAFHHSSFLAGDRVLMAGELSVLNGELVAINARSGHYKPDAYRLRVMLGVLERLGVPLANVKVRIIGVGVNLEAWNYSLPAPLFMKVVNPSVESGHDVLAAAAATPEMSSGNELVRLLAVALFNKPDFGALAPLTYPASYKPAIFEALGRAVHDPVTRQAMLDKLEAGTRYGIEPGFSISPRRGWYNRHSAELDATLLRLKGEIPEAADRLEKLIKMRQDVLKDEVSNEY